MGINKFVPKRAYKFWTCKILVMEPIGFFFLQTTTNHFLLSIDYFIIMYKTYFI